jgi:hypothetical protein
MWATKYNQNATTCELAAEEGGFDAVYAAFQHLSQSSRSLPLAAQHLHVTCLIPLLAMGPCSSPPSHRPPKLFQLFILNDEQPEAIRPYASCRPAKEGETATEGRDAIIGRNRRSDSGVISGALLKAR